MALKEKEIYYIENNHEYKKIKNIINKLDLSRETIKNLSINILEPCLDYLLEEWKYYERNNEIGKDTAINIKNIAIHTRNKYIKYFIEDNNKTYSKKLHDNSWWDDQIKKFDMNECEYNDETYKKFDGCSVKKLSDIMEKRINIYITNLQIIKNKYTKKSLNELSGFRNYLYKWKIYFDHGCRSIMDLEDFYDNFIKNNLKVLSNKLSTIRSKINSLHKISYFDITNINVNNNYLVGKLDNLIYKYHLEINKYNDQNKLLNENENDHNMIQAQTRRLIIEIKGKLYLPIPILTPNVAIPVTPVAQKEKS